VLLKVIAAMCTRPPVGWTDCPRDRIAAGRKGGSVLVQRTESPVAAAACADYDFEAVRGAVREVLAPLGGMAAFVCPGERIAIKPNLLIGTAPERAITTHPNVLAAVALEVRDAGATPVLVDGPGTGVAHAAPVIARAFRLAGYREVADRYGLEISLDTGWRTVSNPEAVWAKRLEVMSPILDADGVINVPKLKTHMFMTLTAATKNLFGVIPGLNKAAYHGKLPEPRRFADMLLDVAYFVRPRLHLVDGITALEGNGPGTGGSPRDLGVLVAGADPVAVDVACCRITGLDCASVPILVAARDRGLWSGREQDVETLGVPIAALAVHDFVGPAPYEGIGLGNGGLLEAPLRWILHRYNRMPRPKAGRCTLCGACERACPEGAITLDQSKKVAQVDDSLCIRCYCCHEMCPEAAIDLEYSALGRLVATTGLLK
jgi:uncharacterized protein (DUF362 family)/Pyruvate/2-oxoacid:ferredoxin oxidoreductase delta subunit